MSNPDMMLAHLLVKNSFISLMSYLYVLKHGKINSIGKQRKCSPFGQKGIIGRQLKTHAWRGWDEGRKICFANVNSFSFFIFDKCFPYSLQTWSFYCLFAQYVCVCVFVRTFCFIFNEFHETQNRWKTIQSRPRATAVWRGDFSQCRRPL